MVQWTIDVTPEVDAQSTWRPLLGCIVAFTGLMLLVVGIRLWYRRRNLQAEDWIIVASAIFGTAFNMLQLAETRYGYGLPTELRPKSAAILFRQLNLAARPMIALGLGGFKLALCVSYLRLLDRTKRPVYRWFIISVAVVSTLGHLAVALLYAFECNPIWKSIDSSVPGTCLDWLAISYFFSAISILSDVVIFLMPIPLVLKLNLERSTKIGLISVFSLGLCTTILTILRTTQIPVVAAGNGTGNNTLFSTFVEIEVDVGIITACLPVLRPLLVNAQKRLVTRIISRQKHGNDTHLSADHVHDHDDSKKLSDRFSVFKSSEKSSISDGDSEEIMLESAPQHNQTYPHPQYRWGDMSIVKTVDYRVEAGQAPSEPGAGPAAAGHTQKDEWSLP